MGGRGKGFIAVAVLAPLAVSAAVAARNRPSELPAVVISEVMTSNAATLLDEDHESSDWIELWNRSSTAVDLTGWRLSDDDESLLDANDENDDDDWVFPTVSLRAGGRMVIFASGKADRYPLHSDFRLSADGEHLRFRDARGREVAVYQLPALGNDVSYGLGDDNMIGVLLAPTPGLPNTATKPNAAAKPLLSRLGGYIDGAVTITATTPTRDAQLWYTTDGSTPTAGHGTHYGGPISIGTTTTLRIVATRDGVSDSLVASATYLVMDEVLAQTGTPLGWSTAPVNGQVYQFGFDQKYVDQHRAQVATALLAAPTLSITTDLDNLIDSTTGIYSNPAQHGAAWERPASIELIDRDSGFQINGGIRLKGGWFRLPTNPKHSFRLTFGPGYEGPLEYPVFGSGGPQTFASVDLRAEQNYSWQVNSDRNTMLRDQFTRESQAAIGDPSTRSRWVHLFLNGQYWGVYMLREDVSAAHATGTWGGSTADYDVLQHSDDYGYEVQAGDDDEWLEMWEAIADGRLTDEEFAGIANTTDLVNLADFMLVNIEVGNTDTATTVFENQLANNWQAVRGYGQPFRFFLDDGEHTLGADDHRVGVDRTRPLPIVGDNEHWEARNFNPGWLHQVLLTRARYRDVVRDRANSLLGPGGALAFDASVARWTALRDQVDPLIEAEAARWGYAGAQEFGRPEWQAEVEWVQTAWFPHRPGIVHTQLRADDLFDG